MKSAHDMILLVNEGKHDFTDKCAGKEYSIPPQHAIKVPRYVAHHFIGNPDLTDELEKAAEAKRVRMRYGAEHREAKNKVPKLRIEEIEQEPPKAVAVELIKKYKAEEPEFPELKAKK